MVGTRVWQGTTLVVSSAAKRRRASEPGGGLQFCGPQPPEAAFTMAAPRQREWRQRFAGSVSQRRQSLRELAVSPDATGNSAAPTGLGFLFFTYPGFHSAPLGVISPSRLRRSSRGFDRFAHIRGLRLGAPRFAERSPSALLRTGSANLGSSSFSGIPQGRL